MKLSPNTRNTYNPQQPEIAKALIQNAFVQDEQRLPTLDELRKGEIEKGGPGSGPHKVGDKVKIKKTGEKGEVKHVNGDKVKVKLTNGSTSYHHHSKVVSDSENIQKAEFNTKERKKLTKEGEARKDGSFPIRNKKDLSNAIHDVGRATNPAGAKSWIKKRAKDLGLEEHLPEDWKKAEDDVTESVGEGPGIEGSIKKGGEDKTDVQKAFNNLMGLEEEQDPIKKAFDDLLGD